MTREQAEIVLHSIKFILDNAQYSDDVEEALNIAIEELKNSERTEKFPQNVSNDDLISRKAAIDAMCELMRHWFGCNPKDEIKEIKRELDKLPAAQPKQKKGKWIHVDRKKAYDRFCSECQKKCWYVGKGDYAYCPNCGAKMER